MSEVDTVMLGLTGETQNLQVKRQQTIRYRRTVTRRYLMVCMREI